MDRVTSQGFLRGWQERFMVFAIAVSIASIVISIGCCIVTAKYKNVSSSDEHSALCIDCQTLAQRLAGAEKDHVILNILSRREEGRSGRCCVETSEELTALLNLILWTSQTDRNEALPTFDPGNFTFSQASAHKRLLPSDSRSYRIQTLSDLPEFPETGYNPLMLNTRTTRPGIEHVRNVDVYPWGYDITHPGLYYVYSSVSYEPASNEPCSAFDEQTWEHAIVVGRFRDVENSGVVARSVHKCCDNCTNTKETSYTGCYIFLNQKDTLRVQVSGIGLIGFRKESTFFGLYMVSGKA